MRSDFLSEKSEMSSVSEASMLLRRVAGPREIGDSVKAAINRAARKIGLTYSRARDIWYANARRIDATEMDALRREAEKQAAAYDRVANAMAATDPDFYRSDIAALVHAARALRGLDRPGNDPEG